MSGRSATRRRSVVVIVAAVVLLGALAGAAYGIGYLFFRAPAPAAVGSFPLATASSSASAAIASASASATAPSDIAESSAPSTDGDWSVDQSIGSFGDFSSSFVGYRVQEELASVGGQTAVGRTPDVTGSLTLDGTALSAVEITADLTTLVSDDDRRDNQLRQQALETGLFPTATFALTEPIEVQSEASAGEEVTVMAVGELTLHGVTREVEVPITARLAEGVIVVTGSMDIAFADYEMEKPSSFVVLSVDDHGVMEFQLFFTQA